MIMNKAFVKESSEDSDDDLDVAQPAIPAGAKNYITPAGYRRLRDELLHLIDEERPEVVKLVSWAASNGDRSENGDYIYGKRRLREIDRRIRFLTKRLDLAEIVDSSKQENVDQVFFGATVEYATQDGEDHTVTIVGVDEVDLDHGKVSWISPIARALVKARIGDQVTLRTPAGPEPIDILDVRYPPPDTGG
jgi:transcription elongation factor GreB